MSERPDGVLSRKPVGRSTRMSRRGVVQASLAAGAWLSMPRPFDLNGARTMAQDAASMPKAPTDGKLPPNAKPPGNAMTYERLVEEARIRAGQPYRATDAELPPDLASLSYEAYGTIRFKPERAVPLGPRFSLQPFHRGFIQRNRVALTVVKADGSERGLDYDPDLFEFGPALKDRRYPASLGYAGFRLAFAFDETRPREQEEFVVFLGASYFRLRGRGQVYGLSARGVAVNTFAPSGEEFPDFTAFWIQEPQGDARTLTVLAALDGPSIAGALRFVIEPGDPSRIAVSTSLHPRREIPRLGLAPLTSMFLHGQNGAGARGAKPFDDFRPQVHDSDGLVVKTKGDRVWRPLVNGRSEPRISAFEAQPLEGFGLMQRERRFAQYLDVQAQHEDRPGLWVEPVAGAAFAAGSVQLFEIPAREEYVDNIVAAFVPEVPARPGTPLDLEYRLTTVGAEPAPLLPDDLARVVSTRVGSAERLRPTNPPDPGRRLYVIDFEGGQLPSDPRTRVDVALSASAGSFVDPYTERVPQTGGWRLYAEYRAPNPVPTADVVLRARLSVAGKPITETWDAVV